MAKQSKAAETVETVQEGAPVESSDTEVTVEETSKHVEEVLTGTEEGQEGQEGQDEAEGNQSVTGQAEESQGVLDGQGPHESMAEGNFPLIDNAFKSHAEGVADSVSVVEETTVEETETDTDVEQGQGGQESDRFVDNAHAPHAECVAEVVTIGNVTVEGEEQHVETYTTVASADIPNEDELSEEAVETENEACPYTLNLAVPTVIYRGPHQSLGEKRFCGVVTVLTAADANGFAQVEFVRPGVGLTRGYIIL